MSVGAVIFDLGGTLVDWSDWDEAAPLRWAASYHALQQSGDPLEVTEAAYVQAMLDAEAAHWVRVEAELWSGPPTGLVHEGFRRLHVHPTEGVLLAALDGYASSVEGWAQVFPDSREVLQTLRSRGYRLGLLSNTWWAAEWHNADLAVHGLAPLLDEVVYTSDLPHSKPHPSVFLEVAGRLGVAVDECVMVGDRPIDDISGALNVGMRAVWKTNGRPKPRPDHIRPSATIEHLSELGPLLANWR
jgi:putative hydrolase of the HAD superfamily